MPFEGINFGPATYKYFPFPIPVCLQDASPENDSKDDTCVILVYNEKELISITRPGTTITALPIVTTGLSRSGLG